MMVDGEPPGILLKDEKCKAFEVVDITLKSKRMANPTGITSGLYESRKRIRNARIQGFAPDINESA